MQLLCLGNVVVTRDAAVVLEECRCYQGSRCYEGYRWNDDVVGTMFLGVGERLKGQSSLLRGMVLERQ